jgi:protein tyrosine/serine phosphatase
MSRPVVTLLGIAVVLALIAAPVGLAARQQVQMRNFRVVREGVLYRSGQMTALGLRRAVHDYGIRTVINLRDGTTALDRAEEEYCRKQGIRFVRLPPRNWGDGTAAPPVADSVRTIRAVLADPANHPVLIHCFAGTHRTGAHCAIYRMEFEGWTNEQALTELKAFGYHNIDEELDVLGYLERYIPTWQRKKNEPPMNTDTHR